MAQQGGLQPYNETEHGWALEIGYKFARYEYQIARLEAGEVNESETIRICNDIIMSLNKTLSGKGFQRSLLLYHQADGESQHRDLVDLFQRHYRSFSHAVYYCIGTAIGQRHLGFKPSAVKERIRQITVYFRVLNSKGQKEMLFNLTEAGCNQAVLPKEPLAAKELLMAMFEPRVILFVSTDPTDTDHVHSGREYREINQALTSSKFGSSFVLEPVLSCRTSDLGSKIDVSRPAYIHFSGHGNVSGLIFENENNSLAVVDHNPLAYFLRVRQEEADFRLQGAFLNACYSAGNGQIIANSTGALVAIESSVSDENAITFAKHFYKALGDGATYESSFNLTIADLGIMSGIAGDLEPRFFKSQIAPLTADERDRETPGFDSPLNALRRTSTRGLESSVDGVKGDAAPPPRCFPDSDILVTYLPERCFIEVQFSPCGDYIITLNREGIVSIWDSYNGGHVSNLLLNGRTSAIAFCPQKKFLACAVKQLGVFLARWNSDVMRTGHLMDPRILTVFPSEQIIVGIALSPGAERVAVISRRGMERTYKIANSSGKVLRTRSLTAGGDTFCDRIAISDDGKALAYAKGPDMIIGEFPPDPPLVTPDERTSGMFSGIQDMVSLPNSQMFIIVGKSCDKGYSNNHTWRRKPLPLDTPEPDQKFTRVVASSDRSFVMVANEEGIERVPLNNPKVPGRKGGLITGILGDQPLSGRGSTHSPQPPPIRKVFMAQKSVTCMALSPSNDRLISASSSGLVKVWTLRHEQASPTILMGQEEIYGDELWVVPPSLGSSPAKEKKFLSASPSRVKGGMLSSPSSGVKEVVHFSSSSPVKEVVRPSYPSPVKKVVHVSSASPVKEVVRPSYTSPVKEVVQFSSASPVKEVVRPSSSSSPVKKEAPPARSSPVKEGQPSPSYSIVRSEALSPYSSPVKEAPIQETPVKAVEKLTIQFIPNANPYADPYVDQY